MKRPMTTGMRLIGLLQRDEDLRVERGGGLLGPMLDAFQEQPGEDMAQQQEQEQDAERDQNAAEIDAENAVLPDLDHQVPKLIKVFH